MEFKFKHFERVYVKTPGVKGHGTIQGIQAEYPVIGRIWIVEMLQGLPTKEYPYTSICVPEACILEPRAYHKCLRCNDFTATKQPDIQGWDGHCENCGMIAQIEVGERL